MHWQTHTVFNQPTPLNNSNLFLSDTALREAVVREGAGWDGDLLASIGQQLGTAESLELGRLANSNPPELLRYDATGARLDDVRFHPAWHLLMQGLIERYPEAAIVFMTPMHRSGEVKSDAPDGSLETYVNIIQEVAAYYALPVLDLYRTSGLQPAVPVIQKKYLPDGLHPSDAGNAKIAARLQAFLESL